MFIITAISLVSSQLFVTVLTNEIMIT